jgi:hypothetical protein
LWSFGHTLVIAAGDPEVAAAFHDLDRLILRRQEQLRTASQRQAGTKKATEKAVATPASRSSVARESASRPAAAPALAAPHDHAPSAHSIAPAEGLELAPRDIAAEAANPRCANCGAKLLPHESACPRCHARQPAHLRRMAAATTVVAGGAFESEEEEADEPMSMWAAVGKLILNLTELALCVMLFCILGAGAVFFAERWEITTRAGVDLDHVLLADRGLHPLATAAIYASALGLMLYYGAVGLTVRNGVLLASIAVGLVWYFRWPYELWMVGVAAALVGLALAVLQAMYQNRFAEPLGVLLEPGRGLLPGRPTAAGLIALAKGVLAGGACGFAIGMLVGFPMHWYGSANGWDVGQQGTTRFALGCGVVTSFALAYLAGQFAMTRAEQIGGGRGMFLGAELWGFCSLLAATAAVVLALTSGNSDRPWWQLLVIAALVVAGATISGGLVGFISGAAGGKRGRVVISKIR